MVPLDELILIKFVDSRFKSTFESELEHFNSLSIFLVRAIAELELLKMI